MKGIPINPFLLCGGGLIMGFSEGLNFLNEKFCLFLVWIYGRKQFKLQVEIKVFRFAFQPMDTFQLLK